MDKIKEKYKKYLTDIQNVTGQVILRFEDDRGMSIVPNETLHGTGDGLFEIAYLWFTDEGERLLIYVEEFGDSVKPYITEDEVIYFVDKALSHKLN